MRGQLGIVEKQLVEMQTRIKLAGGLGDLTGYPIEENGEQVMEIREEYHSDEEDKPVKETAAASKPTCG